VTLDKSTLRAALANRRFIFQDNDEPMKVWDAASMLEKLLPGECPHGSVDSWIDLLMKCSARSITPSGQRMLLSVES
jgi:hypothetical protein